jgi:hypothetical protein
MTNNEAVEVFRDGAVTAKLEYLHSLCYPRGNGSDNHHKNDARVTIDDACQ